MTVGSPPLSVSLLHKAYRLLQSCSFFPPRQDFSIEIDTNLEQIWAITINICYFLLISSFLLFTLCPSGVSTTWYLMFEKRMGVDCGQWTVGIVAKILCKKYQIPLKYKKITVWHHQKVNSMEKLLLVSLALSIIGRLHLKHPHFYSKSWQFCKKMF